MSLSSDLRARLTRVRGRWWLLLAVVAAALLLLALRPTHPDPGAPIVAKKGDLVLSVEVEGELAAVRSTEIGVPPVSEVDFKIAFLAPEGQAVKKGDSVLRLDTELLERQLAEKRAELAEAQKKVEQKQIDLGMKLLDLQSQAAQARTELGRAQLKVDVPAEVQQRIELEKALLDKKGRERDIENLDAEGRVTQALTGAEVESLRQQRDRAAGRVKALEVGIERMNVRAPQDGIVIYRANWRDEKKKVGDSVWFGEVVLALPDLAEMKGDGFVDEADGGPVGEGQPVTVRLEARSDFDLKGKVSRIARTVRQRSWRTPLKGYRVEIALERTDPTFMRPAMRFRGEIETGRLRGLLLVPRDAVFLRGSGPVVWVRRALGWREVRVTLGRSNRAQVEVVSGLAEGDRISPVDFAVTGGEGPARPAGTAG
ncbi:MAG TPA: HlyD family efflux transporter periplasmic adaptor subunit [Vicinamibacteria bacterium]|nr:HlyD family efflux transporter periplasmic adaptor subunit [Vicinamibacteria bacterium]